MSKSYVMNAAARIRRLEQLQELRRFALHDPDSKFVVTRQGVFGLPIGGAYVYISGDTLAEIANELAAREVKALTKLGVINGGSDHPIQSGQTDRT